MEKFNSQSLLNLLKHENMKELLEKLRRNLDALQKLPNQFILAKVLAVRNLGLLGLPEEIWTELTSKVSLGFVTFDATETAKRILGPRNTSHGENWTAWDAAQIAAAADAVMRNDDPQIKSALAYYIGSIAGENYSEVIENKFRKQGQRKKGHKAEFTLLVEWSITQVSDLSTKSVIAFIEDKNNLKKFCKMRTDSSIARITLNWPNRTIKVFRKNRKTETKTFSAVSTLISHYKSKR